MKDRKAVSEWIAAHPLAAIVTGEAALTPLALVLAWLTGLRPWATLEPTAAALAAGVLATAVLIAGLALAAVVRPAWFRETEALVRPLIEAVFRNRGPAAVIVVSALAGVGEELLFRGVLQAGLAGLTGPWPAVALAGLAFGLAHSLSRAYFILATAMGLYLGALYHLSGSLFVPVAVHALYDALAIAYMLCRRADGGDRHSGE